MLKKTAHPLAFLSISSLLLFGNGLLLADSIRYLNSIVNRFWVDPVVMVIILLSAVLIVRIITRVNTSFWFYFFLYICLPFSTAIASIFTYLELSHFYNYVYSNYNVYFDRLTIWAFSTWVSVFVLIPEKWFLRNWQKVILFLPVLVLVVMSFVWTWPNDVFLELVKEDNLIENIQVLMLLIGAVSAIFLAKNLKSKNIFLAGIFLIASLGLFFVAGDEVSWGQRLIGFAAPTEIGKDNLQNEVTVHNLDGIHQLIGYGYVLVGFYGAFAWIVVDNFVKKYYEWTYYFVPPYYLFFFFYLSLVYSSYALGGVNNFREWSEVAELMLYLGLSGFFLIRFLKQDSKNF